MFQEEELTDYDLLLSVLGPPTKQRKTEEETKDEKKITDHVSSKAESDISDDVESEASDVSEAGDISEDVESVECGDPCNDDRDPFKLHFECVLTEEQIDQLANKTPPSYTKSEVSYHDQSHPQVLHMYALGPIARSSRGGLSTT